MSIMNDEFYMVVSSVLAGAGLVGRGPTSAHETQHGRSGCKPIPGFVLHCNATATNIAVAK